MLNIEKRKLNTAQMYDYTKLRSNTIYNVLVVYEIIPYKNTLGETEYDHSYYMEFKSIKALAKHFNLNSDKLSHKMKQKTKQGKKTVINKLWKNHPITSHYLVLKDSFTRDDLL